jgi:hypothetical protein
MSLAQGGAVVNTFRAKRIGSVCNREAASFRTAPRFARTFDYTCCGTGHALARDGNDSLPPSR